ncbi:MAG: DUF1471 domain-containing protein [Bacteroidales bacterium]|nr:DUF1471 domain-containing protein [Candidatus Colicola equi]
MKKILFILLSIFCLSSCSLKKVVSVKEYYPPVREVVVIGQGQQLPDNIERIGSISVGGGVFTSTKNCTYEACIDELKLEAKKAGAQIIHIIQIRQPQPGHDSCYYMTAELYIYK